MKQFLTLKRIGIIIMVISSCAGGYWQGLRSEAIKIDKLIKIIDRAKTNGEIEPEEAVEIVEAAKELWMWKHFCRNKQ
jgi:hypothetical protein